MNGNMFERKEIDENQDKNDQALKVKLYHRCYQQSIAKDESK